MIVHIINSQGSNIFKPKDGKTLPMLYQAMITGSLEQYNGHLPNSVAIIYLNVFSTGLHKQTPKKDINIKNRI